MEEVRAEFWTDFEVTVSEANSYELAKERYSGDIWRDWKLMDSKDITDMGKDMERNQEELGMDRAALASSKDEV